jgi:hypothetical protein
MGSDIGYGDHATDGDGHGHAHGDGADEEGDTVGDPDKHETHSSAADRHQVEQFGVLRKLHRSTRGRSGADSSWRPWLLEQARP